MRLILPKPLTSRPLVSVVVPCYNYGHYLPQAVDSILAQEGVDLEVIIVDDHSTDGSEAVAAALQDRHPEVRLIRNEVNKRHIATYNTGLAQVTGDYVVLLSADDMLAEGSLARAVALMESHPNVSFVYGYCPDFADQPTTPPSPGKTWTVWGGSEWIGAVTRRGDNVVVNPEVVMRGSVMATLVGYDPSFPQAADLLLWLQAATLGDVGRVNGVQAYYRNHARQMHMTEYAGTLTDMRERVGVYRAFFAPSGRGGSLSGAGQNLQNALRSTAREALWCALLAEISADTVGGAESVAFRDFARTIDPAVTRSFLWQELTRREAGQPGWLPDRMHRFLYRVKWAIKWRKWRRLGL